MTETAYERITAALRGHGCKVVERSGQRASSTCPHHEDRNPSVSVTGIEGQALVHCHAGCDTEDVLAPLGLTLADLYDEKTTTYRYDDGRTVERYYQGGKKRFAQSGTEGTPTLYHLARLEEAGPGAVFLVEGEKDVHAIESAGGIATTAPQGAVNFDKVDVSPLAGRHVTAVVDRDGPGRKWAEAVAKRLTGYAAALRFVEAVTGKDAADHIAAGNGLDEFVPMAEPPITHDDIGPRTEAVELDDFLGVEDPEYDWVVPGLIERGDRVILTGGEGKGKSTLLRQLAVQLASGIHPFNGGPITPVRVLLVDLENSQRQTRRKIRPLREAAGDRYKPEPGLHIRVRPGGIDLLDSDDGRWLLDLATDVRPDVLITGPIYKLAGGDPTEERTAKVVSMWLDRIRTDARCSLIIEAHSPYAASGGKRPERPYGASLWSRWPEFGLYLSPEGHLRHWRGPRDEREWPAALQRGGEWPWTAITRDRDILWARIVELCREAGDQLSVRDLAKLTGKGTGTVQRAIEEHRNEWDSL